MSARPITAALPVARLALLAGLLGGCATQEPVTPETWSGRHFYPPEFCLSLYTGQYERTPDYWRIRHWCDQREMQNDTFL